MIPAWLPFVGRRRDGREVAAESATGEDAGEGEGPSVAVEPPASDRDLPSVADVHRRLLGPRSLERTPGAIRTGDRWVRTLWVAGYPEAPADGLLESLYATADTRTTDVSLHLRPRDTRRTLDALENRIEDLEADLEYLEGRRRAGAQGIARDLADHRALYDVLRNSPMRAFDVSMYLAVRGDDRASLPVDAVATAARRAPANLEPVTPRWRQLDALVSASPVAVDRLAEAMETTTPMLAGALGAMFPFVAGAFAEGGIEYGTYALNESPLILDRFARETGYCAMVIGRLGSGKSFSTQLQLLRRAMLDGDCTIVMLDPLEGFAGVNEALGGERVTVGGTRGVNPLELRPTPPAVLAAAPDLDPWAEQVARVMAFFATFFEGVADSPLAGRTQTLRRAVQEAYRDRGITRDPATHGRASPTVRDVIAVLEALGDDPAAFGYATAGEHASVRDDARSLLTELRPSFREGGDLENLAGGTGFDLDAPVVYLDLHQEEGARGRSETSLMMQVLFNAVYERAKSTDRRVVFVIDEAHYLMGDATSLSFLETAVRHSRHYDLSIQFVTQTGGEFALTPEARTIANLCSLRLIHRVDEAAGELAAWFGLTEREVAWVRSATAGNDDDGYAEALLGVDGEGWFPLRVRASDCEVEALEG